MQEAIAENEGFSAPVSVSPDLIDIGALKYQVAVTGRQFAERRHQHVRICPYDVVVRPDGLRSTIADNKKATIQAQARVNVDMSTKGTIQV